jgi:hypothetical protein
MIDILAHNDWKRPICFTVGTASESMIGLQQYLYKEGSVYHLIPFKPETLNPDDQMGKTNSMVMYTNMMTKFKWGNMKHATYLDEQSTNISYPMMLSNFSDLSLGLIKEGRLDLARKVLHKCDEVMPDINPNLYAVQNKITIADTSYKLNELALGNKMLNSALSYITDQLDYSAHLMQDSADDVNRRDVRINLSFLNSLVAITQSHHLDALSGKLSAQLNDYESKFRGILN